MSFDGLMRPSVLDMLELCAADGLQEVGSPWTREVHDYFASVRPKSKGRVIFRLNGRRSFLDVAEPKDIVDGGAQAETRKNFLLLRGCDLDKLTANLDNNLDLALGLGQSDHRLEHEARVCHHADRILGQMQLTQVEVTLEVLEAADEVVLNILGMEDALLVSCTNAQ
jgi:hypothetical protein